jgi:hypothetical protein
MSEYPKPSEVKKWNNSIRHFVFSMAIGCIILLLNDMRIDGPILLGIGAISFLVMIVSVFKVITIYFKLKSTYTDLTFSQLINLHQYYLENEPDYASKDEKFSKSISDKFDNLTGKYLDFHGNWLYLYVIGLIFSFSIGFNGLQRWADPGPLYRGSSYTSYVELYIDEVGIVFFSFMYLLIFLFGFIPFINSFTVRYDKTPIVFLVNIIAYFIFIYFLSLNWILFF